MDSYAKLSQGLKNDTIAQLEKELSEHSLREYIPLAWPVLEPSREFSPNWSIDASCDHLEAVSKGDIKRLLINVPPGTMKSLLTEVLWPSWEWGPKNMPHLKYVSFSYSVDLTTRDNRKTNQLIKSGWYQKLWGDRVEIAKDQDTKTKFENTRMGFKLATSVGGVGTGERGDRVIIDDPHNVKDGESLAKREATLLWFTETLPTRVNDPKHTPIVVIMQRVHDQDVSGLILAQELGYEHLMLPMEFEPERRCYSIVKPSYMPDAKKVPVVYDEEEKAWREPRIDKETKELEKAQEFRFNIDPREEENQLLWPDRMDRESVERDKKVMGSYAVAGQFQQRPAPRGGGLFQRDWFDIVDKVEEPVTRRVRGWDLAASKQSTSPFTAGVCMSRGQSGTIYVEDCQRERGSPGEVEMLLKTTCKQDPKGTICDIPQDPGQAGKSQKSWLAKLLIGYIVKFSPESGSKELRAEAFAAQAEAGNVKIVRGDWNRVYLNELCLFPNSTFKDQADASSRAFHQLIKKREVSLAAPEAVEIDNG